jgi:hypothetical protein
MVVDAKMDFRAQPYPPKTAAPHKAAAKISLWRAGHAREDNPPNATPTSPLPEIKGLIFSFGFFFLL